LSPNVNIKIDPGFTFFAPDLHAKQINQNIYNQITTLKPNDLTPAPVIETKNDNNAVQWQNLNVTPLNNNSADYHPLKKNPNNEKSLFNLGNLWKNVRKCCGF